MCGIAGLVAREAERNIGAMLDSVEHRGRDDQGVWVSEAIDAFGRRACLGHRRLAIIDPSPGGHEPMFSHDGRYVLTFNGEIYNYRELRAVLEQKGHVFKSTSDTEVLLHLYALKGPAMTADLRGMYAFVIWDGVKGGLFAARDPYGIKPLYYADNGRTLRLASQVKALLAGGQMDTAPQPAGHVGFFLWGNVPAAKAAG